MFIQLMQLSKITESYSDAEFLSFLYSEKERLRNKNLYPGWSSWALVCVLFSLIAYCYSLMKVGGIDLVLLYHIFSVFCPLVLYVTHIVEWKMRIEHGDAVRLAHLGDVAPVTMLVFILLISLSCAVVGFLSPVRLGLPILWSATSLLTCVSLLSVYFDRNSWVTKSGVYMLSSSHKWNFVLTTLLLASVSMPISSAVRQLAFGYSKEFELVICMVSVVVVSYLLSKSLFIKTDDKCVDEIIYNYLYRGKNRVSTINELEVVMLGIKPSDYMYDFFAHMIDVHSLLQKIKSRLDQIESDLRGSDICLEVAKDFIKELEDMSNNTKKCDISQTEFMEHAQELLKYKTTLHDKDFVTMLESMPTLVTDFQQVAVRIRNIVDKLSERVEQITIELKNTICTNAECKLRLQCKQL